MSAGRVVAALASALALASCARCGGTGAGAAQPSTVAPEAGANTPDAGTAAAIPIAPPPERFVLQPERPHRSEGGLEFELGPVGHKHRTDGGTVAMWPFRIVRDNVELTFTITGEELYVEEGSLGPLIVLDGRSGQVEVEVSRTNGPAPLEEEEAAVLAEKLARERGMVEPDGRGWFFEDGVITWDAQLAGAPLCRLRLGLHTRRVISFEKLAGWR